jgi:ferritin-like metal-binding protein YciE
MFVNDMNLYDGYLESELIERAHLAEIERALREREEETKRQILELEEILQHQPNDFAD